MISEIISKILNDLGNYLLGSPFSAFLVDGVYNTVFYLKKQLN